MTEELHLSTPRWNLASNEHKVEIMHAYFAGKTIEVYTPFEEWEVDYSFNPSIYSTHHYRVKPEPIDHKVTLYVCVSKNNPDLPFISHTMSNPTHRLSYWTVDGEPQCHTVKLEKL
jgi:hypothetical protein